MKLKEYSKYKNTNIASLQGALHKAKEDEYLVAILNKYQIKDDIACKYTSILQKSAKEYSKCMKCKNILACSNEVLGHCYLPELDEVNHKLNFSYVPCKYQKKYDEENSFKKNLITINLPQDITNASMKNIDVSDKKRVNLIKFLDNFITKIDNGEHPKGLYLSGSFGSGKTYLVSAALNEVAKSNKKVAMVYWPMFIKKMKEFNEEASTLFNKVMTSHVLLIDDLGAETNTNWSRDEILATILQFRMEEHLPTFFTSNLKIEELEIHLSTSKDATDTVKARRIIERIKQLTESMELVSENRRG